jgi:ubiquitin-activating enzyme E1
MTKEGRPFWSLPKRAPKKIEFDPQNELHSCFIAAYACLYANMYKIKIEEENPRSKESRLKMA